MLTGIDIRNIRLIFPVVFACPSEIEDLSFFFSTEIPLLVVISENSESSEACTASSALLFLLPSSFSLLSSASAIDFSKVTPISTSSFFSSRSVFLWIESPAESSAAFSSSIFSAPQNILEAEVYHSVFFFSLFSDRPEFSSVLFSRLVIFIYLGKLCFYK